MSKNKNKSKKQFGVCECGAMHPTENHECVPCTNCAGTGTVAGSKIPCIDCDGTGRIILVE